MTGCCLGGIPQAHSLKTELVSRGVAQAGNKQREGGLARGSLNLQVRQLPALPGSHAPCPGEDAGQGEEKVGGLSFPLKSELQAGRSPGVSKWISAAPQRACGPEPVLGALPPHPLTWGGSSGGWGRGR